jgi:Fe-S cluster assembly ATP-binding protein
MVKEREAMLKIVDVSAGVGEKQILKGLSLEVPKGEVHVVMGPNGVGKSTLSHILMAQKSYSLSAGRIELDGEDITELGTRERALKGLFLAFQYPVAIPGLKLSEYLRNLYNLRHGKQLSVAEFRKIIRPKLEMLDIERGALGRYLNEGFSGGEMKRLEMLQLAVVEPKVAILDEIDSGVDVDAQKIVASAINKLKSESGISFVIITHYQRLLNIVNPDKVHVMLDGKISKSGGIEIVNALEKEGYDWVRNETGATAAVSSSQL